MMSLSSLVLAPVARAMGMGIFFTVYDICIAVAPMLAGRLSEMFGIAAALQLAAGLLGASVCLLPLFHGQMQRFAAARRDPVS